MRSRAATAEAEAPARIDPDDPHSPRGDQMLALRMKELELELCRQEYQNRLLQLPAFELETDREIKLKELELAIEDRPRPAPTPFPRRSKTGTSPSAAGSAVSAPSPIPASPAAPVHIRASSPVPVSSGASIDSPDFDVTKHIRLVPLFREIFTVAAAISGPSCKVAEERVKDACDAPIGEVAMQVGGCPAPCLCASDIITCGNQNLSTMPTHYFSFVSWLDLSYNRITILSFNWTTAHLDKLHTLILNHNSIVHISLSAFSQVPHLKYLDLSSNKVSILNTSVFQDLAELEVLLLFRNHVAVLGPGTFGGLQRLQRLYLSQNRLTQFPLELFVGKLRLPQLKFLDLSYNLLHKIPVQSIISLPIWQQSGLYLHQNQLTCDCTLWAMLMYWSQRHFPPVMDFRDDYKCLLPHFSMAINVFTQMDFMNCSNRAANISFYFSGKTYEAYMGSNLVMHCDSKIPTGNALIFWVSPGQKVLTPGASSENLSMFPNGSLGLSHMSSDDSGIYTCFVAHHRQNLNETIQVTVQVTNSSSEHSRTTKNVHAAFTTLASCMVSVVLVLIYLYLTPCRCWASQTPSIERRAGSGKRVMFLESPAEHAQNGKVKTVSRDSTVGILKVGESMPNTVPAGFLDSSLIL
ncbi:amphoterin-induced protein 2-like [Megalops cyprinoides]|uniref:amphoterin-induced protein 2-like n=1 Tax=Megalops cyprinoides TaxID=118141 RepID=UPI001863A124|nr:amphoterin-induced protein 2-like [Megalops cyprinoides]